MHLVLSRIERISLSNVVASRSFQNILSVLYKYGLGRFVERDFWIERFIERDRLTLDIVLYQDLFDCFIV